ncbi:lamin tail domain-containing protein [Longimicrobium sp.]|uniref:lamin tail domain-containing protein n=1 Tax=Longimicrobium sp. TaxID=2029185 RepID=UPI002E35270B|nr:lamin tail domain-containing protein [Longimicrobium sp.]HEX6037450.1 lamin tail domain-containing protein [Longimicrobium sp.]
MLSRSARVLRALVPALALFAGACSEGATGPQTELTPTATAPTALQTVQCTADVQAGVMSCGQAGLPAGMRGTIFGGQGTYVQLRSSNVAYNPADSILSVDVSIENLVPQAMGTVDGVTPAASGVRIFFVAGPFPPARGSAEVHNADGTGTFTDANQPYFQYDGILETNETSAVKRWEIKVNSETSRVMFVVAIEAPVQPRLVINEIMPNPGGTVQDSVGEYVELYNAGTFPTNMNGFILRDNTAGVTDTIKTDLVVQPGAYVLLGRSANTSKNGGITPDYLYTSRIGTTSTSLTFSNSGSDFFVVKAPTGVTVDSVFYTSGTTTAVSAVARELKNPALDNTLMDGSNWGAATSAYDATNNNRGTPKAQNSVFTIAA